MVVGVIGAMEQEIAIIRDKLEIISEENIAGMNFIKGKLKNKELILVKSGIGKVNAAMCSQILIDRYSVEVIVNTGIAGGICQNIDIGDIVIGEKTVQSDIDVRVAGYELGQLPDMDVKYFPLDKELSDLAYEKCKYCNPDIKVYKGVIASSDRFIASQAIKEELKKEFNASCAEMESASIAHVAYKNKIRCLIIRAISDKANGEAVLDMQTFEKKAIEHCSKLSMEVLENI